MTTGDLPTEARNPRTIDIDQLPTYEIVRLINAEELLVPALVAQAVPQLAEAVDLIVPRLRGGGTMHYFGAGTPARIAVMDAAELVPTYGIAPDLVVAHQAGGPAAGTRAVEGAEDDPDRGAADIDALGVGPDDLVVGIATSGRTPYVLGAVRAARRRGAATVGIACNRPSLLGEEVDIDIAPLVGPEVVAGSTRLKAGTATKMVLNMISTGAMVQIGKTMGNRMVDLRPSNEKLRIRSRRMLRELAGIDDTQAREILDRCEGRLKPALVVAMAGVEPDVAQSLLDAHGGQVRAAVEAAVGHSNPGTGNVAAP